MRLAEMSFPAGTPVDGYAPGAFRVGGALRTGPLLLLPTGPADWGGLDDVAALRAAAGAIDVLLLGLGREIAPVPAALREALEGAGVGVEPMGTPAACRTYNVLLGEGRRVGLAALPV